MKMPIGKYRGKEMSEIPSQYLGALLKIGNLTPYGNMIVLAELKRRREEAEKSEGKSKEKVRA